ncbi:hypothetical protein B6D52_00525 [Candidatus Parcubacteria bacterium 4484_255]|nr:MAG: hypothetical protein B6D52_00525 [Candidatus Parcubacteria bacterium 4484_255]
MITMSDFEKAKQEQEIRRELWRQQQRARMQKRLPGDLSINRQNNKQDKEGAEDEQEPVIGRSFRAIAARLRQQKLEELKKKKEEQKGEGKAEEVKEKIKKIQETAKRLKNIYRIINGTSATTLVGIIVTFLVMNAQLIFGNLLKLKIIPKLSFPEILIILFIDFVVFIAFLVIILLLIAVVAIIMENPIIKFIADFFNLSI